MLKKSDRPILSKYHFGSLDLDWLDKNTINTGDDKKRVGVHLSPSPLVSEFDRRRAMDHKELEKLPELPILENTPSDLEAAFASVLFDMRLDKD